MSIILDRPGVTDAERELRADLVAVAAEVVPVLQANADRIEHDRRVADENIAAIADAGLFRLMQPRRYGGLEADFRTNMEVTRELARGCGSTAWTASLINICAWRAGLWNEQAQDDVWKDNPGNRIASVLASTGTAEPADGGYRVTGRWGWCTGRRHAQWALLGIPITDDHARLPDRGFILVPMSELTVEDSWLDTGMRGTGSSTVAADKVFVPAHRYVSAFRLASGANDNPHKDEVLYRAPFISGGMIILAGLHLGLARAALDIVIGQGAKRGIAYPIHDAQRGAPAVQLAVAKAESLADTAELLACRAAAEVDEAVRRNEFPGYPARARTRIDTVRAIVSAKEAIRELVSAHGDSAFAETSPLQRIWRDSEAASPHAIANAESAPRSAGARFSGGVIPLI